MKSLCVILLLLLAGIACHAEKEYTADNVGDLLDSIHKNYIKANGPLPCTTAIQFEERIIKHDLGIARQQAEREVARQVGPSYLMVEGL